MNRILSRRQELQVAVAYQERVKLDLMEASGGDERKIADLMESIEPQAITLRRTAGELGILDGCPELQIGACQMNNPETFVPQLRAVLQTQEERRKKGLEEENRQQAMESKMMDQVSFLQLSCLKHLNYEKTLFVCPQVTEELRQTILKDREQREQFDLLEQEVTSMRERLHAQEEGLMSERVAWDKKLFSLRDQAADLEKQMQLQSERVRHASAQLRRFTEQATHVVKEKEETCRALSAAALDVLEVSQDFGLFLHTLDKDKVKL